MQKSVVTAVFECNEGRKQEKSRLNAMLKKQSLFETFRLRVSLSDHLSAEREFSPDSQFRDFCEPLQRFYSIPPNKLAAAVKHSANG